MKFRFTVYIFLSLLLLVSSSFANSYTDRRIQSGVKIFRSLVAADTKINKKVTGQGQLVLALVYKNNAQGAKTAQKNLKRAKLKIKKWSLKVVLMSITALKKRKDIAAVFIAQPLKPKDLNVLINYSRAKKLILYSPFTGDVEKGVAAGLSVEARVRPYLNL